MTHLNNNAGSGASANQPVEFNHAITYVNKIKNRFQGQPEVYKQFLEILHTYQKDQKAIKDGHPPSANHLTEAEVYAKVSKLFQNQEDLLSEFGQFLPEATSDATGPPAPAIKSRKPGPTVASGYKPLNSVGGAAATLSSIPGAGPKYGGVVAGLSPAAAAVGGKRPAVGAAVHTPAKKARQGQTAVYGGGVAPYRDVSLAEAGKYGTLNEYAFFDKVRKALRSSEVYNNFLRCLILFNQEIINRAELVQLTASFLQKHPDLFKWFKDFLGYKEGQIGTVMDGRQPPLGSQVSRERMASDSAMEIGK